MPEAHPYSTLHLPPTAPFKLQPSPGKGWGAFATRHISKGSVILTEKPLFTVPKPHEQITEDDLQLAFQRLSLPQKYQFLSLRNNASTPFTSMTDAFAENSFGRSTDAGPATLGLFVLHSRLNHSCLPNTKIPKTDPTQGITSVAMKDIASGEEITFCYESDFECRVRRERHAILRFECDCKACELGTALHRASEIRRVLVRGLQYLTLGVDIDGERHSSYCPIILDRDLKMTAEEMRIPLSSRLIYQLLTMVLLEEEGLLDGHMIDRLTPGLEVVYSLFSLESNVRIVTLATLQKTWVRKFCAAMRLWGRADPGDHAAQELFRAARGLS
ncbi:hypothetical protein BJY01DRAFT_254820 [Aspergillus pseudoustus]|uniref:SET domain-containing protein n=1 Tax=Aspergillus pseudoustus TaxID=1810923 RepID=A0ABR4IQ87_9EURO